MAGCPFCMIKKYGGIPNTFDPTRDAVICGRHRRYHPPHWNAQKQRWIVVVNSGAVSFHCTVPNPETGNLKDPPAPVVSYKMGTVKD